MVSSQVNCSEFSANRTIYGRAPDKMQLRSINFQDDGSIYFSGTASTGNLGLYTPGNGIKIIPGPGFNSIKKIGSVIAFSSLGNEGNSTNQNSFATVDSTMENYKWIPDAGRINSSGNYIKDSKVYDLEGHEVCTISPALNSI